MGPIYNIGLLVKLGSFCLEMTDKDNVLGLQPTDT